MEERPRKIIHVDMDAFYASVEQRDDPRLRGQPVAVAWGGKRSVVLTASYEARPFGVRSAMPLYRALERCPELRVVEPRFEAYREVSAQVREVFLRYTPLVEPLSLDEAYLDVTAPLTGGPSATRIAGSIRAEIHARTGLTATAGVSVNKFLAKLASGLNKPDGLTLLLPEQADGLLASLPTADFHGIGPATARKLAACGIHTGADLRAAPPEQLTRLFGRIGEHFAWIARGQDDRPVEPDRAPVSIGAEETYADDLHTPEQVQAALPHLARNVERRLVRAGLAGRVVILKLKFDDRVTVTRRVSLPHAVWEAEALARVAARLVTRELILGRGVRLVGITVSGLGPPTEPPPRLFEQVD
ncbi:DNA polymerase IV [Deinococcus metallilatus]|uniref:DNA polymerase IV n=1 Tax=Deinococcus metallilatus TaxID=1211322 RepID=A0AAJ5F3I3_9DEIO|nr:DNA polymerase IV [Deinococcus metallilatus]MBB5295009.1 DNA polymerase-4 [Deinococcus metallilatus]QBY09299.1 DNA polymerase IV [Deinococcus metallilatus]RXJ09304.1 DNA polymerase IV [Deinococcus metallilatus]TLK28826.1 DNA polymerase IV [Deinococcus metallilatus]GMA16942.1 DNA polymerase IV [Deinococcus metallilatus]